MPWRLVLPPAVEASGGGDGGEGGGEGDSEGVVVVGVVVDGLSALVLLVKRNIAQHNTT